MQSPDVIIDSSADSTPKKTNKRSADVAELPDCYVTAGTFARRGLSSTAKTLRSLSGVRGSEY